MKIIQIVFFGSIITVTCIIVASVMLGGTTSSSPLSKLQFEGHEYVVLNRSGAICHNANCKKCNPQEIVVIPFR